MKQTPPSSFPRWKRYALLIPASMTLGGLGGGYLALQQAPNSGKVDVYAPGPGPSDPSKAILFYQGIGQSPETRRQVAQQLAQRERVPVYDISIGELNHYEREKNRTMAQRLLNLPDPAATKSGVAQARQLIQEGKEVVVIGHSAGTLPTKAVLETLLPQPGFRQRLKGLLLGSPLDKGKQEHLARQFPQQVRVETNPLDDIQCASDPREATIFENGELRRSPQRLSLTGTPMRAWRYLKDNGLAPCQEAYLALKHRLGLGPDGSPHHINSYQIAIDEFVRPSATPYNPRGR